MDDPLLVIILFAGFLGILFGLVPLPLVLLTRKSKHWNLFRDIGLWLSGFDLLCFLGLAFIFDPTNKSTGIALWVASSLSLLYFLGVYMTKPPDVGQNGELSKTLKYFLTTVLFLTIISLISLIFYRQNL